MTRNLLVAPVIYFCRHEMVEDAISGGPKVPNLELVAGLWWLLELKVISVREV
jgi:hypothetical protein